MEDQSIQIMIVDDHTMVRKGLKIVLEEFEGIRVIGDVSNGYQAAELAGQLNPDVILMDLSMPGLDGIEATRRIIAARPEQLILILTAHLESEKLIQAIHAGAQGFIGKDINPEELVQAIRDVNTGKPALDPAIAWSILRGVHDGETPRRSGDKLSEREIDVLRLLTQGKPDQEIARELVLSEVTIRTHITRILTKLKLKNRVQAALYGLRSGLVPIDESLWMMLDGEQTSTRMNL